MPSARITYTPTSHIRQVLLITTAEINGQEFVQASFTMEVVIQQSHTSGNPYSFVRHSKDAATQEFIEILQFCSDILPTQNKASSSKIQTTALKHLHSTTT